MLPVLPELLEGSSILDEVIRAEDAQAVHDVLRALGDRDREIVILRLWMDLTHAEIAHQLGVPVENVRQQFRRTLLVVKAQLKRLEVRNDR